MRDHHHFEIRLRDKKTVDENLGMLFNENQENHNVSSITIKFCAFQEEEEEGNDEAEDFFDHFLDEFLNQWTNCGATSYLQQLKVLKFDCMDRPPIHLTITRTSKLLAILKDIIHKQPKSEITCSIIVMKIDQSTLECLYPKLSNIENSDDDTKMRAMLSSKISLHGCTLLHGQQQSRITVDYCGGNMPRKYPMTMNLSDWQLNLEKAKLFWVQYGICPIEAKTNLVVQEILFDNVVFVSLDSFLYIQKQQNQKLFVNDNNMSDFTQNNFQRNMIFNNCQIVNVIKNGLEHQLLKFSAGKERNNIIFEFDMESNNDAILSSLPPIISSFLKNSIAKQQIITFQNSVIHLESIPSLLSYDVTQPDGTVRTNHDITFDNCKIKKIMNSTNIASVSVSQPTTRTTKPHMIEYDSKKLLLSLRCARGTFNTTEPISTIIFLLTKCPTFRHVESLQLGTIRDEEISDLVYMLTLQHTQQNLKSLSFYDMEITNQSIKSLADAIKSNSKLEKLHIVWRGPPRPIPSLEPFLDVLKNDMNMTLTELKLGSFYRVEGCIPFQNEINFYTSLNKFGRRRLLKHELSGSLLCLWLEQKYSSSKPSQARNKREKGKGGGPIVNATAIYWMLATFSEVLFRK